MIWNGLALVWIKIPDPQNYIIAFLLKTGHYVSVWILIQSINILDPQNCTYISFFAFRIGTYRKNLLCSGSWPGGPP